MLKYIKRPPRGVMYGLAGGLCFSLTLGSTTLTALAVSPEFAYTAEEWASLRDDTLEYGEIARLIHEYNSTVIQNQLDYEEYRGESRDDISDDYYDAADELYGSLEYPDSSSDNYGSALSSYLSGQLQADSLKEQGDDNVDDGDSIKLGYDQTEASLVQQAQELMISYWSQQASLKSLEAARTQAESTYNSTLVKQSAGMATAAQVLSAKEAVETAEASLISAQSSLSQTRESLCLMLGWAYGSQVDIQEVPEPDLEAISAIDLEADVEKGVENNYALKILARQVSNAQSLTNKEKLEESYKSQKEAAASSIRSAYEELLLAKSDYEQALNSLALEQESLASAQRKLAAGTITQTDYNSQSYTCTTAEVQAETSRLSLLQAQNAYEWAVNGLAETS